MDDRTEGEILARLDYIERYLADLGRVSGYGYAPFAGGAPAGQSALPYDAAPASFAQEAFFGPEDSFSSPVGQPFLPAAGGPGVGADIVALARSGQMIEAIKMYRQRTGVSLKQAKAAVEQAARGY